MSGCFGLNRLLHKWSTMGRKLVQNEGFSKIDPVPFGVPKHVFSDYVEAYLGHFDTP